MKIADILIQPSKFKTKFKNETNKNVKLIVQWLLKL